MIELDLHVGWFVLGGFALLAMTTLPERFRNSPLSLPICYVAFGWVVFEVVDALRGPEPLSNDTDSVVVEYVTELIVIVSLAGAGLKLDRKLGLVSWAAVWRLLSIAMLLTVGTAVVLGLGIGLGAAAAVLLGAVLAPTDPVLADDVQVEQPGEDSSEVRFTLTAEAGLNDGLAFPIAYLAVALAGAGGSFSAVAGEWLRSGRVGVGLGDRRIHHPGVDRGPRADRNPRHDLRRALRSRLQPLVVRPPGTRRVERYGPRQGLSDRRHGAG